MIEVKPDIQQQSNCPHCKTPLKDYNLIWQGMHVLTASKCIKCHANIIEDLKVGHGRNFSYQVDIEKNLLFGDEASKVWLGKPLIESLKNPKNQELKITKEIIKTHKQVIILNCIDFLYGHSLLKLLNAQKYIDKYPEYGLVVIVQKFMRWMVPSGVAEIWTVDIPLREGRSYYLKFHEFVSQEIQRFDNVCVSKAYSHPKDFDISRFTGVPQHNFTEELPKITFVWREDRVWVNNLLYRVLKKLGLQTISLFIQNIKIISLFTYIRYLLPSAKFKITGLGSKTKFPSWIEDGRVEKFDKDTEIKICKIYSDSRLVIGIHGSNMLLPSAHAGMTIDLMPKDRWGNFAQDILYQEKDPRFAAFRYRYLPISLQRNQIAEIAVSMITKYPNFILDMTVEEQ
jgi:hypothetical protein